jgi:cyclophilin family peptidyl-prolyl cis-trans isomerase
MIRLLATFAAVVSFGVAAFASDDDILMIELGGSASGVIEIELLPEVAPLHVERIKQLAREGTYDNIVFHRVIDGFMAQTGDVKHGKKDEFFMRYAGRGASDYPDLKAEFSDLPFDRGVLGMARSQNPNSANSQFFIMFDEGYFLNNQYTVFGRVTNGMDVVDTIKRGDSNQNGAVAEPDYMSRVWIKGDE